jgi:phosphatidylglycerol lysyltransferase
MYGDEGQSYVSMGDPVGSQEAAPELAWDFRELCDVGGRLPVFYQVDEDRAPMYVEMGLTLIKIGEEARVPLSDFSLQGSARKNLRHTNKQLAEHGCTLQIIEPPAVSELLPTLKQISDAWLGDKATAEKGFSLGFFKPDYIEKCPIAIIRKEQQVLAFANLWLAAEKEELSIDLMRYLPDAPHGVMEFLFIQLMLWGKENGYRWFDLGMAPLAGIESQPGAPLWNQLAALTFRHGEHFYNFQGLRQYKDKFDPAWTAKYIASPGGLSLPVAIANVATLISGGIGGLLKK